MHAQHFDEAVGAGAAFLHAGVKGVAVEVVEPVHVELTAHQLVKKRPGIRALEHLNGQIELASELLVQPLHQKQGQLLVRHVLENSGFEGVGEGAVADVVQQDGGQRGLAFGRRNRHALVLERAQGQRHEVHGPQRVVEARVQRPRVHKTREAELLDAPQPLEIRVFDEVKQELRRDGNETVNRVVENLLFIH